MSPITPFTIVPAVIGNPFALKANAFLVPIGFEPVALDLTMHQLHESFVGSNILEGIPMPSERVNGAVHLVHDPIINRQVAFVVDGDHTLRLEELIEAALYKFDTNLPNAPAVSNVVIAPLQARKVIYGHTDEASMVKNLARALKIVQRRSGDSLTNIKSVTATFAMYSLGSIDPVKLFQDTIAENPKS